MISLTNHDSRVRENSEVVIIYPDIYIYIYIYNIYINIQYIYIYIYTIYIYIFIQYIYIYIYIYTIYIYIQYIYNKYIYIYINHLQLGVQPDLTTSKREQSTRKRSAQKSPRVRPTSWGDVRKMDMERQQNLHRTIGNHRNMSI